MAPKKRTRRVAKAKAQPKSIIKLPNENVDSEFEVEKILDKRNIAEKVSV